MEVGLRRRMNRLKETPTKKRKLVNIGMYFITLLLLFLFLMMGRLRTPQGRNLRSHVCADKSASPDFHVKPFSFTII